MKKSNVGIELIKKYEGCVLKSCKCPSGVWTIDYVHISGVKSGTKIIKNQALDYIKQDLITFEKNITNYVKVPPNQNQFGA